MYFSIDISSLPLFAILAPLREAHSNQSKNKADHCTGKNPLIRSGSVSNFHYR